MGSDVLPAAMVIGFAAGYVDVIGIAAKFSKPVFQELVEFVVQGANTPPSNDLEQRIDHGSKLRVLDIVYGHP